MVRDMNDHDFFTDLLSADDVVSEIRSKLDELVRIVPEIKFMINFEHCHPHHHLDVFEHTLLALSHSKNDLKTRTVLLFHDIGKPLCYQQDGEIRHYRGHAEKSAAMAKAILERLGFDTVFTNDTVETVRRHDTPLSESDITAFPDFSRELFEVQKCDALAHNPEHNKRRMDYIDFIESKL